MVTDPFDGAGPLTSPYVDYLPGSANNLTQSGGQLLPGVAAESEGNYYAGAASSPDQFSEIIIAGSLGSPGASTYWTASARVTGTGGSRSLYQATVTHDTYFITKVVGGSSLPDLKSGAASFDGSVTPVAVRIETEDSGDDVIIRILKDGVLVDSYTDADTPLASGDVGFEVFAHSSFLTPLASWSGGNLSAPPPPSGLVAGAILLF